MSILIINKTQHGFNQHMPLNPSGDTLLDCYRSRPVKARQNVPQRFGWVGRNWVKGSWRKRLVLSSNMFAYARTWPEGGKL